MAQPEQQAQEEIDRLLVAAGWRVCDLAKANIHAARGVAIREFPLESGFGCADYLLYVDGKAAGVIEAKKQGATLTGVESQRVRAEDHLPQHRRQSGKPDPRLSQQLLPPLAEQHRIVAEVDRLLSIAREAKAEVDTNLKRAQSLRQAILSKAFCGVPQ